MRHLAPVLLAFFTLHSPFFTLHSSLFALQAAAVPQDGPDKYLFTRPNLPSNILGRVMGDPPAYHVLRSEDVAWLHEAYAERAALMGYEDTEWKGLGKVVTTAPEYGTWPLSATNRFVRWTTATSAERHGTNVVVTTNVVVGYAAVTNLGAGVDTARIAEVTLWPQDAGLSNTNRDPLGYLTTEAGAYVPSARAWEDGDPEWVSALTNVYDRTVLLPCWTNCRSIVATTLTNGQASAWTNDWREFAATAATVRVTNVVTRGTSIEDCIFTNRAVVGYGRPQPGPLRGPYDTAAVTNHYAFLRGLRRLARRPVAATGQRLAVKETSYSKWGDDPSETYVYTNGTATLPFAEASGSRSQHRWYANYADEHGDSWKKESSISERYSGRRATGTMTYRIPWPRLAAIPDGRSHSVAAARLWAMVRAEYGESDEAGTNATDDEPLSSSTNRKWRCVVPLGTVEVFADAATNLCFEADMGFGVLTAAWAATGAPAFPDGISVPSLAYGCPEPTYDGDTYETVDAHASSSRTYKARVTELLVLLDFAPRASLPGW